MFFQMPSRSGPTGQTAKRPECPKSDQFSPFRAFCIVQGQIYATWTWITWSGKKMTQIQKSHFGCMSRVEKRDCMLSMTFPPKKTQQRSYSWCSCNSAADVLANLLNVTVWWVVSLQDFAGVVHPQFRPPILYPLIVQRKRDSGVINNYI